MKNEQNLKLKMKNLKLFSRLIPLFAFLTLNLYSTSFAESVIIRPKGDKGTNEWTPNPTIEDQKIQASSDDAEEYQSGQTTIDETFIDMDGGYKWGGMRYTGIAINQKDSITSAKLTLRVYPNEDDPNLDIYCEDADDASTFSTDNYNISNRTRTANYVNWTETDIGSGIKDTPDLISIVQEVIDRTGWGTGNDIVFIFDGLSGGGYLGFYTWDYMQYYSPWLTVTWAHVHRVDETTADDGDYVKEQTLNQKEEWDTEDVTGTIPPGAVIDSVILYERGKCDLDGNLDLQGRTAGLKIGSDYTWGIQRKNSNWSTFYQKLSAPGSRSWTRDNLDSLVIAVKKSYSTGTSYYVYTSWAYVCVYWHTPTEGINRQRLRRIKQLLGDNHEKDRFNGIFLLAYFYRNI